MANEVVAFNASNLPAFAKKGELSTLAKSLAGGGSGGKRISIKGGVFRLLVDGEEIAQIDERYLDVVVVNAAPKVGRMYYEGKYKDDTATAPVCWSANGDVPDPTCPEKQAKTCATCPQNIKGSGDNDTRACRFSQRLAVVLANDIGGNVMQLSVPAKSLFGKEEGSNRPLQAYAKFLATQHISPEMVVTRMKFDTKAESPKLYFKPMRWLDEEEYGIVRTQGQTPDAISAITLTVTQTDKVQPAGEKDDDEAEAPTKVVGKPAKAAKPAADDEDDEPPVTPPKSAKAAAKPAKPAADDEEEEPATEPTKRAGKAKPAAEAVSASPALASLVSQWGDDD